MLKRTREVVVGAKIFLENDYRPQNAIERKRVSPRVLATTLEFSICIKSDSLEVAQCKLGKIFPAVLETE